MQPLLIDAGAQTSAEVYRYLSEKDIGEFVSNDAPHQDGARYSGNEYYECLFSAKLCELLNINTFRDLCDIYHLNCFVLMTLGEMRTVVTIIPPSKRNCRNTIFVGCHRLRSFQSYSASLNFGRL